VLVSDCNRHHRRCFHRSVECRTSCLCDIPLADYRLPSLLLSNVCHLSNKFDDLTVLAKQYNPDIICITESWLNSDIPDIPVAVNLDGYHIIRKDRLSGSVGGVAVFISSFLDSHELSVENVDNLEILWIKLRPRQLPRPLSCLLVAVVYCPPSYDVPTMKKLTSLITASCDKLLYVTTLMLVYSL